MTQAELAERVGVTPSAITVLLQPQTKQTRLKPKIHKALGLVEPTNTPAAAKDTLFNRLVRAWGDLSETEREHLVLTSELLTAKR